jgi:hypothetical protein
MAPHGCNELIASDRLHALLLPRPVPRGDGAAAGHTPT